MVLLFLLVAVCTAFVVIAVALTGGRRPNLLLITMDTTRADFLGCYGNANAGTPNIDLIAGEGTVFRQCNACSSTTLPSHTSILTSTYPFVHGVRGNIGAHVSDDSLTLAEVLEQAGFRTGAVVGSIVLDSDRGLSQGFSEYVDVPRHVGGQASSLERSAEDVADRSIEFLQTGGSERFFLWAHFYDPHYPYLTHGMPAGSSREAYAQEIHYMDAQIGRIVLALERLELMNDTVVVLVGDHGEGLGQHGEAEHGYFVYQTTLHVPFIIRTPRGQTHRRFVDKQVRTIDVAPTILDLLNLPQMPTAQGISLTPLMNGLSDLPDLAAYSETMQGSYVFGLSALRCICLNGWKYVHGPEPTLHNLSTDRNEMHNVLSEEAEMGTRLKEQLRRIIADAPPPVDRRRVETQQDLDDLAKLQSLGYVGTVPTRRPIEVELDRFEPKGDDPRAVSSLIRDYREARIAAAQRRFERSAELLQRVTAAFPNAYVPMRDLAQSLLNLGRSNEAVLWLERAITESPNVPELRVMYGNVMLQAGEFGKAVAQLSEAVQRMPDDWTIRLELGVARAANGELQEAQTQLEKALAISPHNHQIIRAMGSVYAKQGDFGKAAEMFRESLKIEPNQPKTQTALQQMLKAMGAE